MARLQVVDYLGTLRSDLTLEQRMALTDAASELVERVAALALSCVVGTHNGAELAKVLAGSKRRPVLGRIVLSGDNDLWPLAPLEESELSASDLLAEHGIRLPPES